MNREIGGLFAVFVGVVLVVAAVKGSLKNVWAAVLTPDSGPGSKPKAATAATPSGPVYGPPASLAATPAEQAAYMRPGNILVPPPFPPVPGQPGSGVLTGA